MPLRPAALDDRLIGNRIPWDLYTAAGVLVARAGLPVADAAALARLTARPLFRRGESGVSDTGLATAIGALMAKLPTLAEHCGSAQLEASVRRHAGELSNLAGRDADALLGLARLLPMRDPAWRHSLVVAAVAHDLAVTLGLPAADVASLTSAALTMNLSAMHLHRALVEGALRLTPALRIELRRHPEDSARLLEAGGLTDPVWLVAVRQHHEHLDGSGYPRGLVDDEIVPAARILRVADDYIARISSRRFRPPRSASALRRPLPGSLRGRLDPHLAATLRRRHGAYPPGTLVRLASREVAVVVRRNGPGDDACTAVRFLDARGRLLERPGECSTATASHAIHSVTEAESAWPPIPWAAFWGY